jgi:hypothetical protein
MISGTSVLEVLVDQAWLKLQQVLSVGEKVSLKVKAAGKTSIRPVLKSKTELKFKITHVFPAAFTFKETFSPTDKTSSLLRVLYITVDLQSFQYFAGVLSLFTDNLNLGGTNYHFKRVKYLVPY